MPVRSQEVARLLSPAEVAAMFRVDPKTMTRWAMDGKLTSVRTLGGDCRYREAEVHALLGGDARTAPTAIQQGVGKGGVKPPVFRVSGIRVVTAQRGNAEWPCNPLAMARSAAPAAMPCQCGDHWRSCRLDLLFPPLLPPKPPPAPFASVLNSAATTRASTPSTSIPATAAIGTATNRVAGCEM